MSNPPEITIRPLRTLSEMPQAVELQKVYWGDDAESVIPAHMLFSLAAHGGHVLGAFDGAHIIGVLVGFIGTSEDNPTRPAMANLQIVSKRMVVLPEYRSHGVGYRLKLAQRDYALQQGIRLVTWTFDPLLAPNAHLNIRKLGCICETYLIDYYGTEGTGGLAALGSSDRLLAEWWVTKNRVEERIGGTRTPLTLAKYLDASTIILNPTQPGVFATPSAEIAKPPTAFALAEIPTNYTQIKDADPVLAQAWRLHLRDLFTRTFAAGYVVTDFVRERYEERERAFYVLSYNGPQYDSFSRN
ncbi:MAG: GNAT family N-acetyltransferase [Chloroflexota bacterium]|nr:GNAT family N-acetyltransferase [Chloroflexota bacterium]